MKPLIRLRYILFFTIILGFFATFAQNDYGLKLNAYSELFISITFLLSLFTGYKNAGKKIWFVAANILGSFSFFAFFLVDSETKNGNDFLNVATVLLLVFFLLYGIYYVIQNKTENRIFIFLLSMFFLSSIFSLYSAGFTFPLPLKIVSMYFAIGILMLVFVIMFFQKRNLIVMNENILLKKIRQLPDLIVIIYVFFLWWNIYWVMSDFKIFPQIYSSLTPPALQKLFDEGKNDQAEKYMINYNQFLENRKKDNN